MQDVLEQFSRNNVWTLITMHDHTNVKAVILERVEIEK